MWWRTSRRELRSRSPGRSRRNRMRLKFRARIQRSSRQRRLPLPRKNRSLRQRKRTTRLLSEKAGRSAGPTAASVLERRKVDPKITTAQRVYITFDIGRDGHPFNVQTEQSSGVPALDISATRALQRIDTFGPLPPDYSGNKISVEFWFDYSKK